MKRFFKAFGHDAAHIGLITLAVAGSAGILAPFPFNVAIVAAAGGTQYAISNWHKNKQPQATPAGQVAP